MEPSTCIVAGRNSWALTAAHILGNSRMRPQPAPQRHVEAATALLPNLAASPCHQRPSRKQVHGVTQQAHAFNRSNRSSRSSSPGAASERSRRRHAAHYASCMVAHRLHAACMLLHAPAWARAAAHAAHAAACRPCLPHAAPCGRTRPHAARMGAWRACVIYCIVMPPSTA